MKKILFLVTQKSSRSEKLVANLNKKLKKSEIYLSEFAEIVVTLTQNEVQIVVGEHDLANFNLVYFRIVKKAPRNYVSLAGTLAAYLESKKIKYHDTLFANIGLGNKLYPLVKLALRDIPIIPTIYISRENLENITTKLEHTFTYPFIVKNLHLQRLKGVYVIHNRDELEKIKDLIFDSFLFQQFIKIKDEYRLLVLGGKVKVASKKVKRSYVNSKVDYLDYSSFEEFIDVAQVDSRIIRLAQKSAKYLKIEIAGVDIAVDEKGNMWVIEVNRGPAVESDPKDTPEVEALAKYLEK